MKATCPFSIENSEIAKSLAADLQGGFRPLVVGTCVFIPRRDTSIDEIVEVTGLDECLIFVHPNNDEYFVIDCPE